MESLPSITTQIIVSFAIILVDIVIINFYGFIVGALFLVGIFIIYYYVNKWLSGPSKNRPQSQSL